ncbi:hypothetical protein TspCOW1_21190 [Thiohalobacter sp. COW1]|nr:hypothetical protein TspCOW1_21190 [Thiohalobacter sp. COW1]
MLPNFFVVGAQKAGTTTLHNLLQAHPEIYLPEQKETKFFVDDARYALGIKHYEREYFSEWKNEPAIGEVDPDYMYFPHALERMNRDMDLSATKFIFLLRNPVERAFSHYLMTYRRGLEDLEFTRALQVESERIATDYLSNMHYSYASRGYYSEQLERFGRVVDEARILVLTSEEMQSHPEVCMKRIYGFLDVDTEYVPENIGRKYHTATVPKSMMMLKRLENKDALEKKLLRLLMPSKKLRGRIRERLNTWNQTEDGKPVLSNEAKAILREAYRESNQTLNEKYGVDSRLWS